jgi:hypothetical protein
MVDELPADAPAPAELVRARAEALREDVWAWALTSGPRADATRAVSEQVDALLDEARRTGDVALYRKAEGLAQAAIDEASAPPVKRVARS